MSASNNGPAERANNQDNRENNVERIRVKNGGGEA